MKKTTKELKQKVLNEIKKTENTIKRLQELSKPITSTDAIGRVSRMNAINNQTVISVPLNNAEVKLVQLHKVLPQIGTDEFGKCQKSIALGRILSRPQSLLCVRCAK